MKKQFRTAMLSTACMLIVAVMSLTGVTYAWFSQGTTSTVSGVNVNVEAADGGIFIAVADSATATPGAESYSSSVDLQFTNEVDFAPVSTAAGAENAWAFYTGELLSTVTIKSQETSGNYVKKILFLRNPTQTDITVNLGNTQEATTTITTSSTNSAGQAKTIDNAARLGFRYVNTVTNTYTEATTAGTVNGATGYGIFCKRSTATTWFGINTEGDNLNIKDEEADHLTELTSLLANNFKFYIPAASTVIVEMYVWLEGQDVDCMNENADSMFDVNIVFDVVQ